MRILRWVAQSATTSLAHGIFWVWWAAGVLHYQFGLSLILAAPVGLAIVAALGLLVQRTDFSKPPPLEIASRKVTFGDVWFGAWLFSGGIRYLAHNSVRGVADLADGKTMRGLWELSIPTVFVVAVVFLSTRWLLEQRQRAQARLF